MLLLSRDHQAGLLRTEGQRLTLPILAPREGWCGIREKLLTLEIKIDDHTLCHRTTSAGIVPIVHCGRCALRTCARSGKNQTLPRQAVSRQCLQRWSATYSGASDVRLLRSGRGRRRIPRCGCKKQRQWRCVHPGPGLTRTKTPRSRCGNVFSPHTPKTTEQYTSTNLHPRHEYTR